MAYADCQLGVMACPEGTTKEGFETQFGTNHLVISITTNTRVLGYIY